LKHEHCNLRARLDEQAGPENQGAQLRVFSNRQAWSVVHEFTDVVSGSKSERDRPQFRKLMEAASRREFDLVLFWALDRFLREGVLPTLHHFSASIPGAWRGARTPSSTSIPPHLQRRCDLDHGDHRQAGKYPLGPERIVAGLQRAKRNGSRLGRPQVSDAKAFKDYTVAPKKVVG